MSFYVGIDLGTTNSAICSFDGEKLKLYKNPRTGDVTPSAIFYDRRGNKHVGTDAYDNAPRNPGAAATLFKRMMGTATPILLPSVKKVFTPEECSAEILRLLYGYLPADLRNSDDVGTVITVPAAFNQMQRQATMAAAELADIGKVALMQEPVAAVMSVMRQRPSDGTFLVYDLGGGTLDIAISESTSGRVNLLAHGGIEMCGGSDFDKALVGKIVKPWLIENFDLPESSWADPRFAQLMLMCGWAAEKAKIALSSNDEAVIALDETQICLRDAAGKELYLDIPLARADLDALIAPRIEETVDAARQTLEKVGLETGHIERIVFVGGPTNYKPLRDAVSRALGIASSTDVNPMTAVAEGAAIFAESIDWSTQRRGRKNTRGSLSAGEELKVAFNFQARVPSNKTKIVAVVEGKTLPGAEFQVDSLDTGWTSGRVPLAHGKAVEVALAKAGDNTFKIFVFDASGGPVPLPNDRIVIARTAASIDAIPASHSVGIEVRDKIGGRPTLEYLVQEGDQLPKKGRLPFKAEAALAGGSTESLNFKLWEGEIKDSVADNRFVGLFQIKGTDFEGSISAGADVYCEYEVRDSGQIDLLVSIPCVTGSFAANKNFYVHQAGQVDFSKAGKLIADEAAALNKRIEEISTKVDDERLDKAMNKLTQASQRGNVEGDAGSAKKAMDDIQDAKRLLSLARKDHQPAIRQLELDDFVEFFNDVVRKHARSSEASSIDNLVVTAQRAIDKNLPEFDSHLSELRGKSWSILWRQDWFVVDRFKDLASEPHAYADPQEFAALAALGHQALKDNNVDKLREIVWKLHRARISWSEDDDIGLSTNLLRG